MTLLYLRLTTGTATFGCVGIPTKSGNVRQDLADSRYGQDGQEASNYQTDSQCSEHRKVSFLSKIGEP